MGVPPESHEILDSSDRGERSGTHEGWLSQDRESFDVFGPLAFTAQFPAAALIQPLAKRISLQKKEEKNEFFFGTKLSFPRIHRRLITE